MSLLDENSLTKKLSKCQIAVAQICANENKENNLNTVRQLTEKAVKEHNAQFIFFPEASDYIVEKMKDMVSLAESVTGKTVQSYQHIAKTNNIFMSIGFHEKHGDQNISKVYNTHILISNEGTILSKYRKLHLFDTHIPEKNLELRESDHVLPGEQIVEPISTPAGKLGMLICYDIRFPEVSLALRNMGATLLTYPSAFTTHTGAAHWLALLKVRAIETQCFVIAAAQCGNHGTRISYGNALIIDPWGQILAECPTYQDGYVENGSLCSAVIDDNVLTKVRENMQLWKHRRSDIYNIVLPTKVPSLQNHAMMFSNKPIPAETIFYRSEYSFAFTNIRCVVPGHVLIASNRCALKVTDLNNEEIADLFQVAIQVQRAMEKIHNVTSSTVVVQDGPAAGQTVPHVHCHILPRKPGDFERNDDIYTTLAKHDAPETTQPIRPLSVMIEEANEIRKVISTL